MRISLAQQNYHIGNFEFNLEKIKSAIHQAKRDQSDIILFSELSICGYPPRDFLEFKDFLHRCEQSIEALKPLSSDIAIVVGCPAINPSVEGKDLYNAAYFIYNGEVQALLRKTLLPTYDVFDEYRYFEPNDVFECVSFKGKKIAITICEDIWNVGNANPLYKISPMEELIKQQPDFMLNLSASPFSAGHHAAREHTLVSNIERYRIPIFYCNSIGAQTELIFDGGSMIYDGNGNKVGQMKWFEEDFQTYEWDGDHLRNILHTQPVVETPDSISMIHRALVIGIRDYFAKLGFSRAVLGLSGGIDSALTCVLAAEALGPEQVLAVLLPSQYSTDHSVKDALDLVERIGCKHSIIPIKEGYESLYALLKPSFGDLPFNLTEENLQARIRGILLMALSNKFGNILLNTSNKSEAAVGYGTLYGDMCGGISVLGDLYKTEVYALCRYINREKEIIPMNTITKAPSAELRPGQKDQDSLPPYDILDEILFQYIEHRKGPDELVAMGFDQALVNRILKMVNINEFKRAQTPPILRISNKAFGMGRRMPIVGKYLG